jgi:hypothetical protein
VATIVEIDRFGALSWIGVGNVESVVLRSGGDRRSISLPAVPGILGMTFGALPVGHVTLGDGDVLLMATDGVDGGFRWEVDAGHDLDELASRVVGGWSSDRDDALLLAATLRRPQSPMMP